MGLDESAIDDLAAHLGEGHQGVWTENWPIVRAFLSISTQWRSAFGRRGAFMIGLDYGAVKAGLDALGTAITPELWHGIQMMEAEAVAVLNGREG